MNNIAAFKLDGGPVLSRDQIVKLARMAKITEDDLKERDPVIIKDLTTERHICRADGKTVRLVKLQDTKYGALIEHRDGNYQADLANLETGVEIPDDEPVIIFRAQDRLALAALTEYVRVVTAASSTVSPMTVESAAHMLDRFTAFQTAHPERVKLPT